MNSVEISLAPHKFDKVQVMHKDDNGRPIHTNYYWRGTLMFHIIMTWDAKGWRDCMEVIDDKLPVL